MLLWGEVDAGDEVPDGDRCIEEEITRDAEGFPQKNPLGVRAELAGG